MGSNQTPYKLFGDALKNLRSKAAKTPAEVSGAVEIDEGRLAAYERGEQRPSEDILLLLLQHFDVSGDQADTLWRLAGYSQAQTVDQVFGADDFGNVIEEVTVQVTPHDARIVYTDMLQVMVNNYGVIMNFMQGAGPGNQPLAVSRVGMSKEHAKTVIDVLQRTLAEAESATKQKQLSSGEKKQKNSDQQSPEKD
jgi:transcriptional regulator with XRE-family HTH domain